MTTRAQAETAAAFRCFTASGAAELCVLRDPGGAVVLHAGREVARFAVARDGTALRLSFAQAAPAGEGVPVHAVMAALEALFAQGPGVTHVELEGAAWIEMAGPLMRLGAAIPGGCGLAVLPDMLWQQPEPWLASAGGPAFPQHFVMSAGKRHPRRAPKPSGLVYARYIPWLGQLLSLRTLDIDEDLALFNRWMNDPRVADVWCGQGDLDRHCAYLSGLAADPHMLTLLGCLDGLPFCYFEVYWAKESRLAPFYDAGDYDRGWRAAVGVDACRARSHVAAWLPSLVHYMFLDDPRTCRIVGEPCARHVRHIRDLERSGFAGIKAFDLPHKRALLMMLQRERFFSERLWMPRSLGIAAAGRA